MEIKDFAQFFDPDNFIRIYVKMKDGKEFVGLLLDVEEADDTPIRTDMITLVTESCSYALEIPDIEYVEEIKE